MTHQHLPAKKEVLASTYTAVFGYSPKVWAWVCEECGEPLYELDDAWVEAHELAELESEPDA